MPALKRIIVLIVELTVEAFLLGTFLGALVLPNFIHVIEGVWALAFAVAVVLFLAGYYVTRAFFSVVWRSQKPLLYPAIAMALFVAHLHLAVARSKSDLTLVARATEFPFLAGGACIVFACAFAGNWLLRRWTQASNKRTEPPVIARTKGRVAH